MRKVVKKKTDEGEVKANERMFLTSHPEKFDVVSALSNAHSGLAFGLLLQGDAWNAQEKLCRILEKWKLKLGIIEGHHNEKSCLAVSAVRVHGVELFVLIDTGKGVGGLLIQCFPKLRRNFT